MNPATLPSVRGIDHVHVYVQDRIASEVWYRQVLGFTRVRELESWAADGGPLTVQSSDGTVHIALFERNRLECRSTIALKADAHNFLAWKAHLSQVLEKAPAVEDHQLSVSLYFTDPDGNPYEITTYEHEEVRQALTLSAA